MKKFIVLTAITGELIAVRPSSILHIEECNGERKKIIVKTENASWNISTNHHSVASIINEVEGISVMNNKACTSVKDEEKMGCKLTLKAGEREFGLVPFQSPRGLRCGDKQPDLVTIDCYQQFNQVQLLRFVEYLQTISYCLVG